MRLVTGATGTIGPMVVKLCAAGGRQVRAGVPSLEKGQALAATDACRRPATARGKAGHAEQVAGELRKVVGRAPASAGGFARRLAAGGR